MRRLRIMNLLYSLVHTLNLACETNFVPSRVDINRLSLNKQSFNEFLVILARLGYSETNPDASIESLVSTLLNAMHKGT